MPRYRNGEILDTEIRREEEEQAQQPEAAARQMVTGTPVYGLGGNTGSAYTNIIDHTAGSNIFRAGKGLGIPFFYSANFNEKNFYFR